MCYFHSVFMRRWCLLIYALFIAPGLMANPVDQTHQLNTLNDTIKNLRQTLNQSTAKKTKIENTLSEIETRESQLRQKMDATKNQLLQHRSELAVLEAKSKPLQNARNTSYQQLLEQVHAAYVYNHQPLSKILLTPGNFQKTNQILMYYRYITKAQQQSVKALETSIQAFNNNQRAIQNEYATLLSLQKTQLQNQQALQSTLLDRQTLLSSLQETIKTSHEKLARLLKNRAELQSTLSSLNRASQQATENFVSHISFSKLRGKLPWPLRGQIHALFGAPINQSELTWDGVLIDAPAGTAIRAIADGKVVFSKWLAGYGFLTIINHGNGFMSLYGRNQTLNKKVGDDVTAGEKIASVGQSGGFEKSALYFEIRKNAEALNPLEWCK